ncbi:MAG: 16S rRNA (cytidine(1402)-2'-O)-methyltransferase [Gammaproteobacteria bacterium]
MSAVSTKPGTLFVVATPIGNLSDISPRAVEVLRSVALVLAEDTRVTARLLNHLAISTPLASYRDHNERRMAPAIVDRLAAGADVALVSDAGTPGICDPGLHLVAAAHASGIEVRAVPGPSSITAALSVSGLPGGCFVFEGFLPPRARARGAVLERLAHETRTVVLLEAPHRIAASLRDIQEHFGAERRICVAREISKMFETVLAGTVGDVAARLSGPGAQVRGEFVIVLAGLAAEPQPAEEAAEKVLRSLLPRLPLGDAVAATVELTGGRRNAIYELALAIQRRNPTSMER